MSLKEKQQFLYTEIIEANYDPEQFQQFMERQKGLQLEDYTMGQLSKLIIAFKRQNQMLKDEQTLNEMRNSLIQQVQTYNQHQKQPSTKQSQQQVIKEQSKQSKLQLKQQLSRSFAQYSQMQVSNSSTRTLFTYLTKTTLPSLYKRVHLAKEMLSVKIRSYSKIESQSFFKTNYIVYSIAIDASTVRRRFSEFQWLHEYLVLNYPGMPIPPIPQKTAIKSFDEKHLEQRMLMFQYFLKKIIKIPQLCSDTVVEDFLLLKNFDSEKYQKVPLNKNKILTLRGQVTANRQIQQSQIQRYTRKQQLLIRINDEITLLTESLHKATTHAGLVSNLFLQLKSVEVSNKVCNTQMYDLLSDFNHSLANKLESERRFLCSNLQNEWRYEEKFNQVVLTTLLDIKGEPKRMHSKYKDTLERKEDNALLQEYFWHKELYRIRLSLLQQQLHRQRSSQLREMARDWLQGMEEYLKGVKNQILVGADQFTSALCVSEGRKLLEVQYIAKKQFQGYKSIISEIK